MAGGPGFEPELLGPEPRVLPLNYPPILCKLRPIILLKVLLYKKNETLKDFSL